MSATNFTERQEQAIRRVVERAAANPEVRHMALTDARGAVSEYGGAELPANATVSFVERSPELDALIVMPRSGDQIDLKETTGEERALLTSVLQRATTDAQFRALAASDARAAVKAATGYELQGHINIGFYDQPADVDAVAVLPPFVDEAAELSEAELETVAGGLFGWCICTSACCISSIS